MVSRHPDVKTNEIAEYANQQRVAHERGACYKELSRATRGGGGKGMQEKAKAPSVRPSFLSASHFFSASQTRKAGDAAVRASFAKSLASTRLMRAREAGEVALTWSGCACRSSPRCGGTSPGTRSWAAQRSRLRGLEVLG